MSTKIIVAINFPVDTAVLACIIAAMENDYYCRKFTELEIEMREHNKYRAANPLFIENTHRVTVPKSDDEKLPYKPKPGLAKRNKARYDKCVADGICTECRKSKADRGRMCTPCNEKSKERWSRRSAGLSKRRAARRKVA